MFTTLVVHGVATAQTITFTKIADTETPVPGGTGTFDAFGNPSFSGGEVAFNGFSQGGTSGGVYIDVGGDLLKVIESGEELDGKGVVLVSMGSEALSGDRLAFRASFGPSGGEGIYVATVPEPSREALTLAAVGIVMLVARWARHQSSPRAHPRPQRASFPLRAAARGHERASYQVPAPMTHSALTATGTNFQLPAETRARSASGLAVSSGGLPQGSEGPRLRTW